MDTSRLTAYSTVSTSLALRSDLEMGRLVARAEPLGLGIGGRSALLEVDGTRVFVKRVPLSDRELLPENLRSTANLFGLPAYFNYGIGSPGLGPWRELAAHVMTTNWVLAGQYPGFPLMYHWRVLPDTAPPMPELLSDVERTVAYWGGGQEVRDRLDGLQQSSASLVLFLEHFPYNLHEWLDAQVRAGDDSANLACELVARELEAGVSFMNAHDLLHFDAHALNVLTDGRRLYFADFGLALSSRFDLSPEESDFFDRHRTYDRACTRTHLVHWLAAAFYDRGGDERDELVRSWAEGEPPTGVPEAAAAILARHSPLASVMGDFYRVLQRESRQTPYPLEKIKPLVENLTS
ncbi:protein kinase family protein [Nonomuraea sp. NPDC050153]|uniref:protein kinase family protein n=1 Tax=Nonomuraea sp. NPDC050153 TaxID=3364359 RepID=UPI00379B7135